MLSIRCFGQVEFKTNSPVEYSNYIVAEQEKLGQHFLEFSNVLLSNSDFKANEEKRQAVVKEIELSLRRLRNMAAFENGTEFRNEAISIFELYRDLHMNEYAKIAMLVSNKESSLVALEAYFEMQVAAEKKMKDYTERMRSAQKAFAQSHKMALVENPMQDQFDRILASNIYTREVFLEYIDVAKVNEAWWTAMEAGEYDKLEGIRRELEKSYAASNLPKLSGFMGDTGFRDAAIARINHFKSLASNEYKRIEEVLKNPSRTKEDIDFVNETVDKYNMESQRLNDAFNQAQRELKLKALPAPSAEGK